jgi:hypothetical protein
MASARACGLAPLSLQSDKYIPQPLIRYIICVVSASLDYTDLLFVREHDERRHR